MKVIALMEVGGELAHETCLWREPELVPLRLLSQLWWHEHGRMKGRDSEDEACRGKCGGHTRPDGV